METCASQWAHSVPAIDTIRTLARHRITLPALFGKTSLLTADSFEANRTLWGATTRKLSQTEEMMCFHGSMTVAGYNERLLHEQIVLAARFKRTR
jgi:hypothetical protein